MTPPPNGPTVWLTTLGCSKNQVDSDKVTAMLDGAGYAAAATAEDADVVMVNTCAFIEAARQESIDTILEAAETKREDARLVVLGCMAQRYETELVEALPEADAVIGLDRYTELVDRLDTMTNWQPIRIRPAPTSHMDILYQVKRPTPSTPFAYVKVAEGCDKPCTFCAIPLFRGKQRSRSPVNIREEIASLTEAGVGEIVLVAQDLAAYGRDIGAPSDGTTPGIVDLLRFVTDVDGLRRLRLYYLYPREIRPALIEEMAGNPRIADYFDLSLQHASAPLLRAMKRPGSGSKHLELIERIRDAAPQATLRSSFIVGFPGETDADVEQLAEFLDAAQLDWAGFFPFSPEEGTPAAEFEAQVPEPEKQERLRYLHSIQEDITTSRNLAQRGRILDVLVDQVESDQPVGRSYREAPEIDGVILLDRGAPGQWVRAEITGGYGTDLVGEVVGGAA
ncbi:MAG: 30S ribosomal protein S12 methylthiotransferase RimO [Acidimicrobiia bacterium]|nr:30S ribosomal protein S12 methylthiotransferase RimO [Acidimicrobiia bacterium]